MFNQRMRACMFRRNVESFHRRWQSLCWFFPMQLIVNILNNKQKTDERQLIVTRNGTGDEGEAQKIKIGRKQNHKGNIEVSTDDAFYFKFEHPKRPENGKVLYILLTSCRFLLYSRDARGWWPSLGIACASCKLCETEHKQESLDRSLIVMVASILTNNHFVVFARAVYRRVETHGSDTHNTHTHTLYICAWILIHIVMFDAPFPIQITEVMVDGALAFMPK